MARKPSPWWWEAEEGWYVNLGGQRQFLGKHPEGAKKPKKSEKTGRWNIPKKIEEAFDKLKRGEAPRPAAGGPTVVDVLQAFLTWCKENRSAKTTARYFDFLDAFERHYPGLLVSDLDAGHVTAWLAEQDGWNSTTKRNAITAIQRAFNWACRNAGLARNPVKGMEKPDAKRRVQIVTPEEFEKLLAAVPDRNFHDLLVVSYDSGGRPFEVKELEARHVQLDRQRAVIPAEEAKGRKHPRTVYFPTDRSMDVIRRRCLEYPAGPLFRNRRGNKWTGMAVKCRLEDLDHVLGRRVTHYALRHSFITRKLVAGVDSHVVASLAGHRDTGMIDRVYSHVADDHAFMLEQARKDVPPKKGEWYLFSASSSN